jgi:hypothetical protein
MSSWDGTSGDCTLSHLRLKQILEKDNATTLAMWDIAVAEGVHMFLCGVTLTGSVVIIDAGILKEGRLLGRVCSAEMTPTIGPQYPKPATFKVSLTNDSSSIKFKVTTFSSVS